MRLIKKKGSIFQCRKYESKKKKKERKKSRKKKRFTNTHFSKKKKKKSVRGEAFPVNQLTVSASVLIQTA